jgi:hypothetical protein
MKGTAGRDKLGARTVRQSQVADRAGGADTEWLRHDPDPVGFHDHSYD